LEEGPDIVAEVLEVLDEVAAAIEPRQSTRDNPAHRQALRGRSLDPSASRSQPNDVAEPLHCSGELRSLVAGISEQLLQERIHPEQGGQQQHTTVTVLDVRWMHHGVQQKTYRVDQDMPLDPLDFLARVIPGWIDAGPPFSALFTLWLSITQAVGLASRPAAARHCTYST